MHTCSTENGPSGSPILNLSNNKVIGIHKQSSKNFNYNIGTCLKFPLNDFFEKNQVDINIIKEKKENNIINNDELDKCIKINDEFNKIIRTIGDSVQTLKHLLGTGPEKKVIFNTTTGYRNTLYLNYGITIDQMLKIYLRIIGREDLYNNKNIQVFFLYNATKVKFGDKTPLWLFFRNNINPKVVVVNIMEGKFYHYTEKAEEEYRFRYFCQSLISEIKGYLQTQPQYINYKVNNKISDITIKFNKKGKIIKIKMSNNSMVAELINEYFVKTNERTGIFNYNDSYLSPMGTSTLDEVGLKDNSEIIVK